MNEVSKIRILFEQGVFEISEGRIGPNTFLRRIQDELQGILVHTSDENISNAAIEAKTTLSDLEQNAAMDEINRITDKLIALTDNFKTASRMAVDAAENLPSTVIANATQDMNDLLTQVKETTDAIKTELKNEDGVLGQVSIMLNHLEEIEENQDN